MSLLVNSMKASQSPGGFKSIFSIKAILFCCFKQENEETGVEIQRPSETYVWLDKKEEDIEKKLIDDEEIEVIGDEAISPKETQSSTELDHGGIIDEDLECPEADLELEREENQNDIEEMDIISDGEVNVVNVQTKVFEEAARTAELRLRIGINSDKKSLTITIIDAYDLARPSSSTNSIREHQVQDVQPVLAYSIHILVLPIRKLRFKTKMRQGPDPCFDEIIKIPKVNPEDVKKWILRFRLYGSMRNSMKLVLGEGYLFLESLDLEIRTQCRIALMNHDPNVPENVVNTMMSTSLCKYESMTSLDGIEKMVSIVEDGLGSEVLLGLSYNSNTGKLTMEVIKGTSFPKLKGNKAPDTQVTVTLTSNKGEDTSTSKTVIKKGTCEPVFEEKFIFQILIYQLDEITLVVTGKYKRSLGRMSTFGSFFIGSKNSTEDEVNHWKDLTTSVSGDQIIRWHKFQSLDSAADKTK